MNLNDALELKNEFPEETKGFNVFQIREIWQEYSDRLSASWIIPEKEDVEREFNRFR